MVVDNVLNGHDLDLAQQYFGQEESRQMHWVDGSLDAILDVKSPMSTILAIASKVVDLSGMAGVEQWCHSGTKPNWHTDKDEALFRRTGGLATPLCSIVFYAHIQWLTGGKFMTENITVEPKTNRLVVFGPGILHGVEDFTGTRVAVAINPWDRKPEGY